MTVRIARENAGSPVASTPVNLALARHQAIRDLIGDPLPRRRDRQGERAKKPPKNTFPSRKRDRARPPSQVTYKIKIKRMVPSPAQTP